MLVYSERAFELMRKLRVIPTPRNYSVFFSCAAGQHTDLVAEIDRIVTNKEYLSEEVLDHMFVNYIAETQSRAVLETATNTKKIITDMIRDMNMFNASTQSVRKEVGQQIEQFNETELTEGAIRDFAKTVIKNAQTMQISTESVNEQLAQAQKEIFDLRENLAKVTIESERDFLTHCYNRKAFDRRLVQAMEEALSKDSSLCLAMIDIDHFKEFNDKFGHLTGDEVLKFVAKTITDSVKGMDMVARFGGEEFVVILPRTPLGGGMILADSIRKAVAIKELKRKSTGEQYGHVTISIGVSSFRPGDSANDLIKRADEALYRSKKSGRNRVTQENIAE